MTRSKFMKGLVLTSSILLVASFLCYRAGFFPNLTDPETALQTSPNGSSIGPNTIGKPEKLKDSTPRRRMLSSSKSMTLVNTPAPAVTPAKARLKPGVLLTEQQILSSSKSAIIFKPADSTKYNYKRYKADTDSSLFK